MLRELELSTPADLRADVEAWVQRGAGVLHVVADRQIIGALAVKDKIRPESRAAVRALQDRGVKVAMITGDARQVAEAVGAVLMSLSTIIVALNAQLLRRVDLDPAHLAATTAKDRQPAAQTTAAAAR